MEQIVYVEQTFPDGRALVRHQRRSACSGDCHQCAGCGDGGQTLHLTADNPIEARPGDRVVLRSDTGLVLRGAMLVYALPIALFFPGYLLGAWWMGHGPAFGCAAFALGIGAAVLLGRRMGKRTTYTITDFAPENLGEFQKKGDNDLD